MSTARHGIPALAEPRLEACLAGETMKASRSLSAAASLRRF